MKINRDGREQFASLELLRAIASLMIVLFHAHSIAQKHAIALAEPFFDAPLWWHSCIDLFFTMSGFLMIHMSRNLYGAPNGLRVFAIRRLSRTPPLYWIYTTAIAALFLLKPAMSQYGPIDWQTYLGSIFFYPMERKPVIAIGWTLNYEIFFYCIIGLSLLFPYEKGWKFAIGVLASVVALGKIFAVTSNPWLTWTDPLMLDFVIGILVAVIYYRGVAFGNWGSVALVALGMFLITCYRTPGDFDFARIETMGIGMGLIIAAATWRKTALSFGKAAPIISQLSQQAYTMYLCHILVLKCIEMVYFKFANGWWANVGYILGGTLLTIAASKVLYELLERPLTEYLRLRVKKMLTPTPKATAA